DRHRGSSEFRDCDPADCNAAHATNGIGVCLDRGLGPRALGRRLLPDIRPWILAPALLDRLGVVDRRDARGVEALAQEAADAWEHTHYLCGIVPVPNSRSRTVLTGLLI